MCNQEGLQGAEAGARLYAPGRLEARGYNGGRLSASDVVETTGAPAKLRLRPDRTRFKADGEEVIMIEVDVLDVQDRLVPTTDDKVSFQVSGNGQIAGVGNGVPYWQEYFPQLDIPHFHDYTNFHRTVKGCKS